MVMLRRGPIAAPSMPGRMDQEIHRRARAGMRVHDDRGTGRMASCAGQRLADDAGEEARRRLVGLARPHADGRQPDADAVEEAAPRIVGKDQLADSFCVP